MSVSRTVTYGEVKEVISGDLTEQAELLSFVEQIDLVTLLQAHELWGQGHQGDEVVTPVAMEYWQDYLAERWKILKGLPEFQYQHNPSGLINRRCILLADLCESVLNISRFKLLFPEIESIESNITSTSLLESGLAVTDIVLSDDNKSFIEVSACLTLAENDGVLKHTQLLERGAACLLSENEANRVVGHSSQARKYYQSIKAVHELKTNGSSLGSCLNLLIEGLLGGGSQRRGEEMNAGERANLAILNFAGIYDALPEVMKDKFDNMSDDHHSFPYYWGILAKNQQEKIQAILDNPQMTEDDRRDALQEIHEDTGTCVELTANGLAALLSQNKDELYEMSLSQAGISVQVKQLEERCQHKKDKFMAGLKEVANGADYHSAWIDSYEWDNLLHNWCDVVGLDRFKSVIEAIYETFKVAPSILLGMMTDEQCKWFVNAYFNDLCRPMFQRWLTEDECSILSGVDQWSWMLNRLASDDSSQFDVFYVMRMLKILMHVDGLDINWTSPSRPVPALLLAIETKKVYVASRLVAMGADLTMVNERGDNALMSAVRCLNNDLVADILAKTSDKYLRTENHEKEDALQIASKGGNSAIVDLLIRKFSDYDASAGDNAVEHAFMVAVDACNGRLVRHLVQTRETINVNMTHATGLSTLMVFAAVGDIATMQCLIDAGAKIDAKDQAEQDASTYLLTHITYSQIDAILSGCPEEMNSVSLLYNQLQARLGNYDPVNYLPVNCDDLNQQVKATLSLINVEIFKSIIHEICNSPCVIVFEEIVDKFFSHLNDEQLQWIVDNHFDALCAPLYNKWMQEEECQELDENDRWNYLLVRLAVKPSTSSKITELCRILVMKKGIDINWTEPDDGCSALMSATQCNSGIVKLLLSQPAIRVNDCDSVYGETPLMYAVRNKSNIEAFDLLLKAGADPTLTDRNGNNVLMMICEENNMGALRSLYEYRDHIRTCVMAVNKKGKTAYAIAAKRDNNFMLSLLESVYTWDVPSVHIKQAQEQAFAIACKRLNRKAIRRSIRVNKYLDLNKVVHAEGTLLMKHCVEGDIKTVQALIDAKANLDFIYPVHDKNALHLAVEAGFCNIVKLLIESGAKCYLVNAKNQTPYQVAKASGRNDVMAAIQDAHKALFDLVSGGEDNEFLLSQLIKSGLDINCENSEGDSLIAIAARSYNCDIFFHLLNHSTIKLDVANRDQHTPLMLATMAGIADNVRLLLSKNYRFDLTSELGVSVLRQAIKNTHSRVVLTLLMQYYRDFATKRAARADNRSFFGVSRSDEILAANAMIKILDSELPCGMSLSKFMTMHEKEMAPHKRALNQGELKGVTTLLLDLARSDLSCDAAAGNVAMNSTN